MSIILETNFVILESLEGVFIILLTPPLTKETISVTLELVPVSCPNLDINPESLDEETGALWAIEEENLFVLYFFFNISRELKKKKI